jgi:hypothetical protein
MNIGDMFYLSFLRLKINTDKRQQLCFDNIFCSTNLTLEPQ